MLRFTEDWLSATNKSLIAVAAGLTDNRPFLDPEAIIAIGKVTHLIQPVRSDRHSNGKPQFAWSLVEGLKFDAMVTGIRDTMHDLVWPILIKVEMEGAATSFYPRLKIHGIGLANKLPRGPSENSVGRNDRTGATYLAMSLENIRASAMKIDAMVPRSNREVRSWSSISRAIGTDFCHRENIHARTEAEFIAKNLWTMQGDAGLATLEEGNIEKLKWLVGNRFVSEELHDLDTNPRGNSLKAEDVIEQIARFVSCRHMPEIEP